MSEFEKERPATPEFDKVVDRAVEIFQRDDFAENGEAMDGGYAWAEALHELTESDQDALRLVTDIVNSPALSAFMPFWDGEGDSFRAFVAAALIREDAPFVGTIANQIPDYDEVVERRKRLVNEIHRDVSGE